MELVNLVQWMWVVEDVKRFKMAQLLFAPVLLIIIFVCKRCPIAMPIERKLHISSPGDLYFFKHLTVTPSSSKCHFSLLIFHLSHFGFKATFLSLVLYICLIDLCLNLENFATIVW
jgi:hypothetical protein